MPGDGLEHERLGDTKIAAPLVRVAPGASMELAGCEDQPAKGVNAADVVPHAAAHWRSKATGLR